MPHQFTNISIRLEDGFSNLDPLSLDNNENKQQRGGGGGLIMPPTAAKHQQLMD